MYVQHGAKINTCNNSFDETNHAESCHGHCERKALTDLDVDLHNERQRWQERGMPMQGIPQIYPELPHNGILINLLDLETQVRALIQLLFEDREEEFIQKCQEIRLNQLIGIREQAEKDNALGSVQVFNVMPKFNGDNPTDS